MIMNYGNYYYPSYYPNMNGAMQDNLTQLKNPPNNSLIWVQGEAGAKAYLVAPNSTVTLWDTESPTIYIKSADFAGVPSLRILDFTERGTPKQEEHVCQCGKDFVKISDFETLKNEFKEMQEKFKEITKPKAKKGDAE